MTTYNKINYIAVVLLAIASGCTKLDQKLNSTLTSEQASGALGENGTALLLQTAYNDVGGPYTDPGNILALEEVTGDECVVPTRAGDWDDNGKWRALKKHTWQISGVDIIENQFNNLNKLNFDATNVLAFSPTPAQAAEAKFLRALALYQLLDLYGQFPLREPGEDLLLAPKVYRGEEAVQLILSELNAALTDIPANNPITKANRDAIKVLLMRTYLNHGAFVNRAAPTFTDADLQQVITLGNEVMGGSYSYNTNYFDNFNATNSASPEAIFAYPNFSGVTVNNSGVQNMWWATVHYNTYQARFGSQGGWNGFSTVSDFYNSFGVSTPATQTPNDTLLDKRIGGRFYPGVTNVIGLRPGLMIGQQYNENGVKLQDRKGNLLIYDPNIVEDLKEIGNDLEIKGIRIVKYPPDLSDGGKNYGGGTSGNWVMIFRYPDVVLMVAEAKMRLAAPDNAGALALVNGLRAARGAAAMTNITLVNTANVADPTTLLAERGRELYWELVRRTDLIRFGVFQNAWELKPASDATHLLFPIPAGAIASNPNLVQNPGYQ